MTETGKVTKIDGCFVTVNCKPFLACYTCGGRICGAGGGRDIVARNSSGLELAPDDYAEISVSAGKISGSLFRAFGLPVLAFAAAYGASSFLPETTEKTRVLAGLAGCLAGVLAACLLGKRKRAFPEVLRTIPAPGDNKEASCPEEV